MLTTTGNETPIESESKNSNRLKASLSAESRFNDPQRRELFKEQINGWVVQILYPNRIVLKRGTFKLESKSFVSKREAVRNAQRIALEIRNVKRIEYQSEFRTTVQHQINGFETVELK